MKDITFRWLPPEEYPRLNPIFEKHDWAIPHPAIGAVRVAELEGEIIGVLAVDLMPHLGPIWIDEEHRGNPSILGEGVRAALERIESTGVFPGMITIAENPMTEKMAEKIGMQKARGVLYRQEFRRK